MCSGRMNGGLRARESTERTKAQKKDVQRKDKEQGRTASRRTRTRASDTRSTGERRKEEHEERSVAYILSDNPRRKSPRQRQEDYYE